MEQPPLYVRYADNIALVAETGEQLQQMNNNINNSYKKYGIRLNTKKIEGCLGYLIFFSIQISE